MFIIYKHLSFYNELQLVSSCVNYLSKSVRNLADAAADNEML
jgi:hypothetical protein